MLQATRRYAANRNIAATQFEPPRYPPANRLTAEGCLEARHKVVAHEGQLGSVSLGSTDDGVDASSVLSENEEAFIDQAAMCYVDMLSEDDGLLSRPVEIAGRRRQ